MRAHRGGLPRSVQSALEDVLEQAKPGGRPTSPFGTCRDCGATVVWADLPDGRRPVDPDPAPEGMIVLWKRPDGSLHGQYLHHGEAPPAGTTRRTSHFDTCPAKR